MAQCRMIAVYSKHQCLADFVNKIKDPKYILKPLIDQQHKILEENKDSLVKNQLSQEDVAKLLKTFQTMETILATFQSNLNEIKQLCFILEKNLILHYQDASN